MKLVRRAGTRSVDDGGYALVAVMVAMVALTMFAMLALTLAVRAAVPSRSSGDVVTATAAAQAGIDEYVARLAENSTYYGLNGTGDDPANKAFTVRADGTPYTDGRDPRGVQVPGTSGQGAYFRYQLLTTPSQTSRGGTIRLKVTGTSTSAANRRAQTRTLTATLQQPGFLQYIYVTDVEAVDPSLYDTADVTASVDGKIGYQSGGTVYIYKADPSAVSDWCSRRYYEGRNAPEYTSSQAVPFWQARSTYQNGSYVTTAAPTKVNEPGKKVSFSCQNIQFGGGDVITGALHSNDALLVAGPVTFQSAQTETSWADSATPAPPAGRRWWTQNGTTTVSGNKPVYSPPLSLPQTNDDLRTYAATAGVGCTYTGETRIRFEAGKMKVLSPGTTSTQPGCLVTSQRGQEQTLSSIPSVVYVRDSTAGCTPQLGYPRAGEDTSSSRVTTDYNCRYGTAFVEGQVTGQVTIATERDVVITGDLTYAGGTAGNDVLGLIPNNFAWVYNPVGSNGQALPGYTGPVTVEAAILSLQHSFLVQNWRDGAQRGTLKVNGIIAQKYRGPVGTSGNAGTGFIKNYVYDDRLRYLPPPYFLAPEATPWAMTRLTDG